jgi:hypothetical protein
MMGLPPRSGDVRTPSKCNVLQNELTFSENDVISAPFLNLFDEGTPAI